ncbi:hypothetical protein AVJ23_03910 [Pseudoponticoccus marisrubri]|uniref:Uncharacterized protein n=2 Tax=Pseudoponticoccus marisrubri TaxID=1685382 RepID=A0A0W7WMC0_9RHOB|nr:hypothetical protein AVJ23_03910 [Pseudoponticoccus marisrubri]
MRNHLIWSAATAQGRTRHVWHQRTPASGRHMTDWGRRADAFIAVSRFTCDSLPGPLRPHARVVYNPFVVEQQADPAQRAALRAEIGAPPDAAVIGFAANFSDRKRPELFVEIAARVAAEYSGTVRFPMFGALNEPQLSRVRARIAELGLEDRVLLIGPKRPFVPLLAGLSVLVAPARREALGRTLIEAGLAGVPVVATREGGNLEIVEDGRTGRLVPPDDTAGFAAAVLDTLANPQASDAQCRAAQARCRELFSLDSHLARIEEIYAGIVG